MPRDLPVGNGRLLVNFDARYEIRDIYFPHVGKENHTSGYACRFGVWVDGAFAWVSDDGWSRELAYVEVMVRQGTGADLQREAFAAGGMEALLTFLEQRSAMPWEGAQSAEVAA